MAEEKLNNILKELNKIPGVKGSVIISYPEGIPIASTWEKEMESITASGLVASVKLTLDNLYSIFRKSKLSKVYVESEDGNLIITDTGKNAIIISFLSKYANIPAISFEIRNAAIKIEKILA